MPSYFIDGGKQGFIQTGIRGPAVEWDERADGSRRPSDRQSRDSDTGMPVWLVEVIYTQVTYGREATVTAKVSVPAEVEPVGSPLTPIEFSGLVLEVRATKAGALVENWRAEGIASGTTGLNLRPGRVRTDAEAA